MHNLSASVCSPTAWGWAASLAGRRRGQVALTGKHLVLGHGQPAQGHQGPQRPHTDPSSVPKDRRPHSPLGHPRPHRDPDAPQHLMVRTGTVAVPLRELVPHQEPVDLLGGGLLWTELCPPPSKYTGFPGGSYYKESICNAGDPGSLGREDSLEEGMATHSSTPAWRIPWTEEPGGYSPWGSVQSSWTRLWTNTLKYASAT